MRVVIMGVSLCETVWKKIAECEMSLDEIDFVKEKLSVSGLIECNSAIYGDVLNFIAKQCAIEFDEPEPSTLSDFNVDYNLIGDEETKIESSVCIDEKGFYFKFSIPIPVFDGWRVANARYATPD